MIVACINSVRVGVSKVGVSKGAPVIVAMALRPLLTMGMINANRFSTNIYYIIYKIIRKKTILILFF